MCLESNLTSLQITNHSLPHISLCLRMEKSFSDIGNDRLKICLSEIVVVAVVQGFYLSIKAKEN